MARNCQKACTTAAQASFIGNNTYAANTGNYYQDIVKSLVDAGQLADDASLLPTLFSTAWRTMLFRGNSTVLAVASMAGPTAITVTEVGKDSMQTAVNGGMGTLLLRNTAVDKELYLV